MKNLVTSHSRCEETSQGTSDEVSSYPSINKKWNHLVVLHGKEKEAAKDVWGIWKAIGLHFEGDNHNMFSVLSRAGNGRGSQKSVMGVREGVWLVIGVRWWGGGRWGEGVCDEVIVVERARTW